MTSQTARSHNMRHFCAGGPTSENCLMPMTMTGSADSIGLAVCPSFLLLLLLIPFLFLPFFFLIFTCPFSNPLVEWEYTMMRKRYLLNKDGTTYFTLALIPNKVQRRRVLWERPPVPIDGTMFAPSPLTPIQIIPLHLRHLHSPFPFVRTCRTGLI